MSDGLIPFHGGSLVKLLAGEERIRELTSASRDWPSWSLTSRQISDLELLLNGALSPLNGFMERRDHESVCHSMRLANGLLWPVPITLDIPEQLARKLSAGMDLALRDPEGVLIAALHVSEVWRPDSDAELKLFYGAGQQGDRIGVSRFPGDHYPYYVGGRVEGLRLPIRHDFRTLRFTPAELREFFSRQGWRNILALQTHHVLHKTDLEGVLRTARERNAPLLVHPSVGFSYPGADNHYTRIRCYQALLQDYPGEPIQLALAPLCRRTSGLREILWHAIVRKNFGCRYVVVQPDSEDTGERGAPEPQHLLGEFQAETGIEVLPFRRTVYAHEQKHYLFEDENPPGNTVLRFTQTDLHHRLEQGKKIPNWFTPPGVIQELSRTFPPRLRRGFTLFLTGLSGAGKSTIANILDAAFRERGGRPVTVLDGDIVRKHLSSELGFSREHRDLNIRRIGFVASEITKNGGITICAPIAPYDSVRREVRSMVEAVGSFILVYIATPLHVCEGRDRKGLYAKARAGLIQQFTGISDPYEAPLDAQVVLDTTVLTPEEAAAEIIAYVEKEGYISRGISPGRTLLEGTLIDSGSIC